MEFSWQSFWWLNNYIFCCQCLQPTIRESYTERRFAVARVSESERLGYTNGDSLCPGGLPMGSRVHACAHMSVWLPLSFGKSAKTLS